MKHIVFLIVMLLSFLSCQMKDKEMATSTKFNLPEPPKKCLLNNILKTIEELTPEFLNWIGDSLFPGKLCYTVEFYTNEWHGYNLGKDTLIILSYYYSKANIEHYKGTFYIDNNPAAITIYDRDNIGKKEYEELELKKIPLEQFDCKTKVGRMGLFRVINHRLIPQNRIYNWVDVKGRNSSEDFRSRAEISD